MSAGSRESNVDNSVRRFEYPPFLTRQIREEWAKFSRKLDGTDRLPALPDEAPLLELLEIVYHTSLLKEEGRKLEFHVIACPKNNFETDNSRLFRSRRYAVFSAPREFTSAELRRLAPAVHSVRSMICVDLSPENRWQVWGLLDTGSNWSDFLQHESSGGRVPPQYITVSSNSPGELVVSAEGNVLLSLRGGRVQVQQADPLFDGPISKHLQGSQVALYRDVLNSLKKNKWDEQGRDDDYPKRYLTFSLSRIINRVRQTGHGGTLLLVPDELSNVDSRLTDRVTIKHSCAYDHAWSLMVQYLELHHRYYELHFSVKDSNRSIDIEKYKNVSSLNRKLNQVEEELADCFRFIARLASVDGAVVLTQRLRVLGFGAEVIVPSPTLKQVKLALDVHARETKAVHVEEYGTRHRSALRFCSSYEEAIAFIVSQDGGTKAAKRIGADIIMWPEIVSP